MNNETTITVDGVRFEKLVDYMVANGYDDAETRTTRRAVRLSHKNGVDGKNVACSIDGMTTSLLAITRKWDTLWLIRVGDVVVDIATASRANRADGTRFIMYVVDGVDVADVAAIDGVRVYDPRGKMFVGE